MRLYSRVARNLERCAKMLTGQLAPDNEAGNLREENFTNEQLQELTSIKIRGVKAIADSLEKLYDKFGESYESPLDWMEDEVANVTGLQDELMTADTALRNATDILHTLGQTPTVKKAQVDSDINVIQRLLTLFWDAKDNFDYTIERDAESAALYSEILMDVIKRLLQMKVMKKGQPVPRPGAGGGGTDEG